MARDGSETRTRLLDCAEALILDHGYAGTSVDAIIERAGVTKGAFFHHFPSKAELAHALVERYAANDAEHLDTLLDRAGRLSRDPLQQVLILVGLLAESMEGVTQPNPGCLFASYCYEAQLFDDATHAVIRRAFARTRERLGEKLRQVSEAYPPQVPIDLDSLADMMTGVFEGAFVLARTMRDPRAMAEQLRHYRNYLELLFGAAVPAAAGPT